MSRSNAALRTAMPAPGAQPGGAEARPDAAMSAAERPGRATQARRTAEPATLEAASGAEVAAVEIVEIPDRDLVAGRPARPAAGSGSRHAPGTPTARIYQRGRSPLQSGQAREASWLLTFEPRYRTEIDFLMGWTGSRDTLRQVELRFSSLDEAVAFAKRRGLQYVVESPRRREVQPKSYADNFRHDRLLPWTH